MEHALTLGLPQYPWTEDLMAAILCPDNKAVADIFDSAPGEQKQDAVGEAVLFAACADSDCFEFITNNYVGDINTLTISGKSLLHMSTKGSRMMMNKLVKAGLDIRRRALYGNTILHEAASLKHYGLTECLLARGFHPDTPNPRTRTTPLHIAAKLGDTRMTKLLLDAGANPNCVDQMGGTPLLYCTSEDGKVSDLTKQLLGAGANPLVGDPNAYFLAACHRRDINLVQAYIEIGIHPSRFQTPQKVANYWANCLSPFLRSDDSHSVGVLIRAGAAVNIPVNRQHKNTSPLHRAARSSSIQCLPILLEAGADVDGRDDLGRTPLMVAVAFNNVPICQLLIRLGKVDINAMDDQSGMTALHRACDAGYVQIAKLLLQKGANPNMIDMHRATPLMLAVNQNHVDVVKELILANCQLDAYGDPLKTSIERGYVDILYMLLTAGINITNAHSFISEKELAMLKGTNQLVYNWLRQSIDNPRTLKGSCRVAMRCFLGVNIQNAIWHLDLPKALKEYIVLKELEDYRRGKVNDFVEQINSATLSPEAC